MTAATFLVLLPALLGLAGTGILPVRERPAAQQRESRLVFAQNEIVLKITLRPHVQQRVEWVERKGPECVPANSIRGAMLSGATEVDFILKRRNRLRAELADDCPALDFYDGFYVSPEGEEICAGRDVIRSRVGGSCRIERFRELVPMVRR